MLKELSEAFQILSDYGHGDVPLTSLKGFILLHIRPEDVSQEDIDKLKNLGVHKGDDFIVRKGVFFYRN